MLITNLCLLWFFYGNFPFKCALRFQVTLFPTCKHGCHGLVQVELRLQVLGEENDESGDDDEFGARPQAGEDVDFVGEQPPHRLGDVLDVLPVRATVVIFLNSCTGPVTNSILFC